MKRSLVLAGTGSVLVGISVFGYMVVAKSHAAQRTPAQQQIELKNTSQQIIDQVLIQRSQQISADPTQDFGGQDEINILLLGLDAREGQTHPHCDAIHLFTFDLKDWSIQITSVPRGTYAALPAGGTYEANQYYVSNACGIGGLDYGIEQIQHILGVKPDYIVKVGFSQAEGVFRLLQLPASQTLQWLRHRQSYQIGEPQRTHNQAVFMKDMIVAHIRDFQSELTAPLQYVLYAIVDTNMDFSLARSLLKGYLASDISQRSDDITLVMQPYHQTVDYHYDPNTLEEDLQKKIDFIQPLLNTDDFSGRSLEDIQAEVIAYLQDRLDSDQSINDVMQQQLWLQINQDVVREQYKFWFTERYFKELAPTDQTAAVKLLSDYILEQQALGVDTYNEIAKQDLESLVETMP